MSMLATTHSRRPTIRVYTNQSPKPMRPAIYDIVAKYIRNRKAKLKKFMASCRRCHTKLSSSTIRLDVLWPDRHRMRLQGRLEEANAA